MIGASEAVSSAITKMNSVVNQYQKAILGALSLKSLGSPIYEGTVSQAEKERRRKRDKAARAARRVSRRHG